MISEVGYLHGDLDVERLMKRKGISAIGGGGGGIVHDAAWE